MTKTIHPWCNKTRSRIGNPIQVECKIVRTFVRHYGYGSKIPTDYMVRVNNKWRRVYCCVWSNAGTCFLGSGKEWQYVVE